MDEIELTEDSKQDLDRRDFIGQRCIALAFDGPWTALDEAPDAERETYAKDAVSNILTAIFGCAGVNVPTKVEDHVVTEWKQELQLPHLAAARQLLEAAFDSWIGDAEDYTTEPSEDLTW